MLHWDEDDEMWAEDDWDAGVRFDRIFCTVLGLLVLVATAALVVWWL